MEKLLHQLPGQHYIHEKGFCLSFLTDGPHGKIAAVGVLPEYRGKGLGTAFMKKAQAELRNVARANGEGELKFLEIGSMTPRFWPQVPIDFPQEVKDFFLHRGFRKSTEPAARDLYRDIRGVIAAPEILERVSKMNLKFSPWSPELYEECMTKQRANFSWVGAYETLAAYNQHHEVMVAFDPGTNAQIGWTLMCSHSAIISNIFTFLPLMPSKEKTGLIAAIGVDDSARGKGVGLALMVKAMENMRERGVEGVFIDWVVIRGFYERLGFETYWEYEGRLLYQTDGSTLWELGMLPPLKPAFKHDDYLMLASTILYAAYTGTFIVAAFHGTNISQTNLNLREWKQDQIQYVVLGSQSLILSRIFYMSYLRTLQRYTGGMQIDSLQTFITDTWQISAVIATEVVNLQHLHWRIPRLIQMTDEHLYQYNVVGLIFTILEPMVGILYACLPVKRHIFLRIHNWGLSVFSLWSGSRSTTKFESDASGQPSRSNKWSKIKGSKSPEDEESLNKSGLGASQEAVTNEVYQLETLPSVYSLPKGSRTEH
ncbi:hypothetical protein G7Y89_g14286 [Cudoniella acicularis]|uniref:N-acetyltransferase domain-containing protein n=1 Tax=Cudoniella acicularis TaxID=354080 RepID=A0A8H4VWQ9_9HELO|nr:hypothetical protein G7Y89_g14286 [Cudoniella acicularis]